jgi:hypothetical protein
VHVLHIIRVENTECREIIIIMIAISGRIMIMMINMAVLIGTLIALMNISNLFEVKYVD